MTVFSNKLDHLPDTAAMVVDANLKEIVDALRRGRDRIAIAVGSGGSAVVAEYFAHCRSTLSLPPTIVQTPMELVLGGGSLAGQDVWLFSAGANNPDIAAALQAALASDAASVTLLTVRGDGATALRAATLDRCRVQVLPVADPKDGFLATHSMMAMVAGLLFASDALAARPIGRPLRDRFLSAVATALGDENRRAIRARFAGVSNEGTLLLLHDPQLKAAGVLVETSLWETALCAVQRTDFRNFAHGRHVWLAKRPDKSTVLALTASESREVWEAIDGSLPAGLRRITVNAGLAGRFSNAVAVMEGLAVVEAIGLAVGIDPGRPGVGDYAKAIYEDPALQDVSDHLSPAVRHKRIALLEHDTAGGGAVSICATGRRRLGDLTQARFRGIVLDYDGTVVATEARLQPPDGAILDELSRLIDGGIHVAIATGRGGSAGEMLRNALPPRTHPLVIMGYYNGAYIRTLDVDIREDPPEADPDIWSMADWLTEKGVLAPGRELKRGPMQITLNHSDLLDPAVFPFLIAQSPPVQKGRVRVLSSHHSFDIVRRDTSKTQVTRMLVERIGDPSAAVLNIGDSGAPGENDHELLSLEYGISVDSVCGDLDGCWSLFGERLKGPPALLRILSSMRIDDGEGARLDGSALRLDE